VVSDSGLDVIVPNVVSISVSSITYLSLVCAIVTGVSLVVDTAAAPVPLNEFGPSVTEEGIVSSVDKFTSESPNKDEVKESKLSLVENLTELVKPGPMVVMVVNESEKFSNFVKFKNESDGEPFTSTVVERQLVRLETICEKTVADAHVEPSAGQGDVSVSILADMKSTRLAKHIPHGSESFNVPHMLGFATQATILETDEVKVSFTNTVAQVFLSATLIF
jgi:hypothetical protein